MSQLIWLLPAAACLAAEAWFCARGFNRDAMDPDSYEIHEQWFVLVLGIIATAGAIALGTAAAFSELLEGEPAVLAGLVGAAYVFLLSGGMYCVGSYFERRVTVTRQSVTYRNMAWGPGRLVYGPDLSGGPGNGNGLRQHHPRSGSGPGRFCSRWRRT